MHNVTGTANITGTHHNVASTVNVTGTGTNTDTVIMIAGLLTLASHRALTH
jgi:hypothetical protein